MNDEEAKTEGEEEEEEDEAATAWSLEREKCCRRDDEQIKIKVIWSLFAIQRSYPTVVTELSAILI